MNNRLHKTIFKCNTGLKCLLLVGVLCLSQITFAKIYNTQNISGSLNNNFDADRVQSEIDLQVEVTQEFSRNLQDLNHRQNQRKDDLKAQLERNEITQQYYNEQVAIIERQNLMVNMIAGGLMSPSDSILGIATSTVAPAVSFRVGQHFKNVAEENKRQGITEEAELTTSQEIAHIATHAVLGALTSAANGGNALSGAVSAGSAEYIAQKTAETLFQKDADELTADEKQTVSSIAQIVGTVSGSLNGDTSLDAYVGNTVATNAVENNQFALPRPPRGNPVQSTANPYTRPTYNRYLNQVRKILRDENFNGLPSFRDFDPVTREGIITEAEVREMQRFTDFVIANQNRSNWTSQDFVYYFYNPSLIGRNNNVQSTNTKPVERDTDYVRTEVGSYTNYHASGKTYSGKGTRLRSQISGQREAKANNDPHIATGFTPARNNREAFKDESRRIDENGGKSSSSNYNRIESPGKKYRQEDGEL